MAALRRSAGYGYSSAGYAATGVCVLGASPRTECLSLMSPWIPVAALVVVRTCGRI